MAPRTGIPVLLAPLLCTLACRSATNPPPAPAPPEPVRIIVVGDIMLSRNVANAIRRTKNPLAPFEKVGEFLKSGDANFGNLESPFSGSDNFLPSGNMIFNVPRENVRCLEEFHFKVISAANNHAFDQGKKGVLYTRQFLNEHGIRCVGTGETLEEAWRPEVLEIKGTKIAFLAASYASVNDSGKAETPHVARTGDLERLRKAVAEARAQADVVIVSMHAGTEYAPEPTARQEEFAHAAVDAGADVVVGSHPHCIQRMEKYREGLIFYSLGNFVFDQNDPETKEGLAVKLTFAGSRVPTPEFYPVIIEHHCCARPATAEEAPRVLKRLEQVAGGR